MQTTTFRCGHCNNLMAVSSEYLGKQVQCPTCRQVVLAPAAPAAEPAPAQTPVQTQMPVPEPQPASAPSLGPDLPLESFTPATTPAPAPMPPPQPEPQPPPPVSPFPSLSLDTEHDSIFSNDESNRDDLFDDPAPVLAPTPMPEYQSDPTPAVPVPPLASEMLPSVEEVPSSYPEATPLEPVSQQVDWGAQQPAAAVLPDQPAQESELPSSGRETRRKKGPELNWPLLLMIPLVSYAILSTALIFYLWNRMEVVRNSVADPIERMPDIHGDAPGATKKSVRNWTPDDSHYLAALPSDHKARLGQKIVVGNLEVEPLRVERGKVDIKVAGYNPEPTIADCLILRLRFRNLSEEYTFAPLDNAFDRKWKNIKMDKKYAPLHYKPFTVLQVGSTNYFGGTAPWVPRPVPVAFGRRVHVMWMEGPGRGEKPVQLDPGQTLDSFVATDGDDEKLVPTALAYNGDLTWRVHVRQGPVQVKGRSELVPSTTVVAVSFKPSEVIRN